MPDANSPAGPGKPTTQRREAASEREQLEEMSSPDAADPTRGPRTAERDAHGTSRDKNHDSRPNR